MVLKRCLPVLLMMLLACSAFAQTESDSSEEKGAESALEQDKRIEELEKIVRELKAKIEQAERADEMRSLMEEARRLSDRKEKDVSSEDERRFYSGLRQHSALNPNISVGGDYYYAYGRSESEYNRERSDINWGTGRFFLREMEIACEAALDPYARGKAFFGFGEEGADVCEAYMTSLNWPLNMNLKLGKYKMQFGSINRWHCHALPQFDRPLVMTNFFSNETLKGIGVAANFLLPSMTAHVNELDLEVATAGADRSFTNEGKRNLVIVSHYKNYWDLNRSTYIECGLSGATGHNDSEETYRTVIGGADLKIKWAPPGRSKYRGIEWWTEALFSRRETVEGDIDSWGIFSFLQCRLGARWILGCRFDYSQLPHDNCVDEYGGAVNVDFWQSEFVVCRLQYTHIERSFDEDDRRIIVQTVWAMGPHKHEAY
jgi:hypothetical protein